MVSPSTSSRICLSWSPQQTAGRAPSSTESSPPSGKTAVQWPRNTATRLTWKQTLQNWVCIYLMFRLNYCNAVKMERKIDRRIPINGETAALSVRFSLSFCRKITSSILIYITHWQPDANESNLWLWFMYTWALLTHHLHPFRLGEFLLLIWSEFRTAYSTNSSTAVLRLNQHNKD